MPPAGPKPRELTKPEADALMRKMRDDHVAAKMKTDRKAKPAGN
jgi:hypothetical protein